MEKIRREREKERWRVGRMGEREREINRHIDGQRGRAS